MHAFRYKGLQQNYTAYYLLRVKARGTIRLRTILFDDRSSRIQNRVKAAI